MPIGSSQPNGPYSKPLERRRARLVTPISNVSRKKEKIKEKKITFAEERQKKLLERLGFMQLMFDFYTAPVV